MKTGILSIGWFVLLSLPLILQGAEAGKPSYALEAAVFYFDHPGGPFQVCLQAGHPGTNFAKSRVTPALLATLYDPEGHPVQDFYWYDAANEKQYEFRHELPEARQGFWELRVAVSRACGIQYQVQSLPAAETAVMAARCWIWYQDTLNFARSWFMVPEDQQKPLEIFSQNVRVRIAGADGQELLNWEKGSTKLELKPGEVYQLGLSTSQPNWNWSGLGGMPVIFCPTPEMARRLKAGRGRSRDGLLLPLGFQKRFLEWRATIQPEDLAVKIVDPESLKDHFLKVPGSQALLKMNGPLACLEFLLASQNVDAGQQSFGASRHDLGPLAYLYSLDQPWNPYCRNPALLKRLALASLCRLSLGPRSHYFPLVENGSGQEIASNYAGGDGMVMVSDAVVFYLLEKDLDPGLRALWSEALGFPLRRFFNVRESCENQTAHLPVKLWLYGAASGQPLFQEIARNFVRDMNQPGRNPFLATGYLEESYGPDATYQGISNSLLAFYAHFSRDPEADRLLDTIFTFLNHSVAPEPDGSIFGASGFCHRTMGGWYMGQYGGGTRLAAGRLASAACWHQKPAAPFQEEECLTLLKWIKKDAPSYYQEFPHVAGYSFAPYAPVWYEIPGIPVLPAAKFPVLTGESFRRSFGSEFLFVREPAYYSGHYFGRSSGTSVSFAGHPAQHSGWRQENGVWSSSSREIFMPLPGPQLFWTPDYGSALVSMNWTLFTHWTVRLQENGDYDWVDYWKSSSQYLEKEQTLIFEQPFRRQAAVLRRRVRFGKEELGVALELTGRPSACTAVEQFPSLHKDDARVEFQRGREWLAEADEPVGSLRWINARKHGVQVKFSEPVVIRQGGTFQDQGKTVDTLEITLPLSGRLEYTISGF